MKTITLKDFLTYDEYAALMLLRAEYPDSTEFVRMATEYLTPLMPEIDRKLGQPNDARYLAYAILFIFTKDGA